MTTKQQQILAYYFPQYHSIPENDEIFGENFTDWDLFKGKEEMLSSSKFPLEPPIGLGYYDPTSIDVRRKQATLAKKYGVDGFIFYHYWLENKPVMNKVLDNLLNDNEPNVPFCICFANDSWRHCYGNPGNFKMNYPDGSTFRQLYDEPLKHAQYLQKLFKHVNYIKLDNKPVIFIYKSNTASVYYYLKQICFELKTKFEIDDLYVVANSSLECVDGYQTIRQQDLENMRKPDAYSPFAPHRHIPLPATLASLPQIYPGYMGWNAKPRHSKSNIVDFKPHIITKKVCQDLLYMKLDTASPPIYAIFAWNEWAEGAIIEPNTIYNEDLGLAIKTGREIADILSNNLLNIVFYYGYGSSFIEITINVYLKCVEKIDSIWSIFIPKESLSRDKLFGDPFIGFDKVIKVVKDGVITIYENRDFLIPIL